MRFSFMCIIVLINVFPSLGISKTIIVPDDYLKIQDAVYAAVNNDTIIVKPDTYYENVIISNKSITIKSAIGPDQTIIDGKQSGPVVDFDGANSVLDGFTITNGTGYESPITKKKLGGGIYVTYCTPIIQNNRIVFNTADIGGGIMGITGIMIDNAKLINNLISNNNANELGGGIGGDLAAYDIINCTITNNTADIRGGGIYLWMEVCGFIYDSYLHNSIVWGNHAPNNSEIYISVPLWVNYSNIKGGWPSGTGNIDADPLFVDPSNQKYLLQQDPCQPGILNPCVDTGDPASSIEGSTRTDLVQDSGIVDMGYHYPLPKIIRVPMDFSTIQKAINAASYKDTVLVYPNTYSENIDFLGKTITVTSTGGADKTVIDGSETDTVVNMYLSLNAVLDGFSITNGHASEGGGIITGNASIIRNNIITKNYASKFGGGIYGQYGLGTICHNIITENHAGDMGGGIYGVGNYAPVSGTIKNNIFYANTANHGGGMTAYYVDQGGDDPRTASLEIINNMFVENSATAQGGGICFSQFGDPVGDAYLFNNAFIRNSAGTGGGIYCYVDIWVNVVNATFTENSANNGGGIYTNSQGIKNAIFWNNHASSNPEIAGNPTVTYSVVAGGWQGTGNKDEDPLFANPELDDIHLLQDPCQPGVVNPCVGAADPNTMLINGTTKTDWMEAGTHDMGFHYFFDGTLDWFIWVPYDYSSIQAAIDAATDWYTIQAASSTYKENINFHGKRITVKSEQGPGGTVIDGMKNGIVVTFENGEGPNTILDGFTIMNGKANQGGGIRCDNGSSPTIFNNVISGNLAGLFSGIGSGGGIYCVYGSNPTIKNNFIFDNTALGDNKDGGSAICCKFNSAPLIINNTVSQNIAVKGKVIFCDLTSVPIIKSSIVWGNSGTYISGNPTIIHSDVEGILPGQKNIDQDPLFADPSNDDFHLSWRSPCINRGYNEGTVSYDMDGSLQPYMGTVDMGADEFTGVHPLEADAFELSVAAQTPMNFTLNAGSSNGNRMYIILGCITGSKPGIPLPGGQTIMPVNWDIFTNYIMKYINKPIFSNFMGLTDPSGKSLAVFDPQGALTGLVGITMTFAYALNNPWNFASNPVSAHIVP